MKKFKIIEKGRNLSVFNIGLLSRNDSSKINGGGCLGYDVTHCDCANTYNYSVSCTIKGACPHKGIGCIGNQQG